MRRSRDQRETGIVYHTSPNTTNYIVSLTHRFGPVFFRSEMGDSRSLSTYPRTFHHPHTLLNLPLHTEGVVNNSHEGDGEAPTKRPRLLGDLELETPGSAGHVPLVGSAMRERAQNTTFSPTQVCVLCVSLILISLSHIHTHSVSGSGFEGLLGGHQ